MGKKKNHPKTSSNSNQKRILAILQKKNLSLKTQLPFPGPKANQHPETAVWERWGSSNTDRARAQ